MTSLWHHFLAWLRGDLEDIVSDFEAIYNKLGKHAAYKTALAADQHEASKKLLASAEAHQADAGKTLMIRDNVGKIIGK